MQLSMFFGMMMLALLEVVRTQYTHAYGYEAKESFEYVVLISSSLLILFVAFPDWD